MEHLITSEAISALLTLTFLEIVLGIDKFYFYFNHYTKTIRTTSETGDKYWIVSRNVNSDCFAF